MLDKTINSEVITAGGRHGIQFIYHSGRCAGTVGRVGQCFCGAVVGLVLVVVSILTLLPGTVGLASLGMLLFMVGLALIGPALVYE